MENNELIRKYERQSGKKAIVDGQETIGFKRWKQQEKSDPKLKEAISTFKDSFRKDIKDIIQIYLEKTNIRPSQKEIFNCLKNYIQFAFPSKVIYNNQSIEIDSDGELFLYNLGIKDLRNVKELFKLRFLKSLIIHRIDITKIPKEIGRLTSLETLDLKKNNVTEIPKEIGNLTNMKTLNIVQNNITKIPKEIGNLTNLESLDLTRNNVSEIPKEICNLKSLDYINLNNNNITTIPKEISNLSNLEFLWMENNNISIIPQEIGRLTNLKEINLKNNTISTIPKEIGRLTNLKYLHIDNNDISKDDIPSIILNNENITINW